jgi:hypothetical protein
MGKQLVNFITCSRESSAPFSRLAAASDKVYQLLAHGRWFSPGTPASSTTKTGRHDIAEILLKVVLRHQLIEPPGPSLPLKKVKEEKKKKFKYMKLSK